MNAYFIALLMLPAVARAAINPADWKYSREIEKPSAKAEYAGVDVDAPTHEAARADLSDIRILDAQGAEIPFALLTSKEYQTTGKKSGLMTDLGHTQDATSFIIASDDPLEFHNRILIQTSSQNFRRRVQIEASDDKKHWRVLRDDAVIFRISSDYSESHLSVDYPRSTQKYLRATIFGDGQPPLNVLGASIIQIQKSALAKSTWAPAALQRHEEGKTSVWDVDMGFENVPVSNIEFTTPEKNFQRHAAVTVSGKDLNGITAKRIVGSALLNRMTLQSARGENIAIELPPLSSRRFRIEIDNGDNPPLKIDKIIVHGPAAMLFFPVDKPWPYRLLAGNAKASAPNYDLAASSKYLNLEKAPRTRFIDAAMTPNQSYREVDDRPLTDRHKGIFWACLIGLCAFLAIVISKKIREIILEDK